MPDEEPPHRPSASSDASHAVERQNGRADDIHVGEPSEFAALIRAIQRDERILLVDRVENARRLREKLSMLALPGIERFAHWTKRYGGLLEGGRFVVLSPMMANNDEIRGHLRSMSMVAKEVLWAMTPMAGHSTVGEWIDDGLSYESLIENAEAFKGENEYAEGDPNYLAESGQMLYDGGDDTKVISDFACYIEKEITKEDGDRLYELRGHTVYGRHFSCDVPAGDFESNRKLKRHVGAAAGAKAGVRQRMTPHLGAAIKAISKGTREVRRYERTGWSDEGFLVPGRVGYDVDLSIPDQLVYRLPQGLDRASAMEGLESLITSHSPKKTLPIFSFLMTGPVAHVMDSVKRYAFFVRGITGTLKTSTAQAMMSVWGRKHLEDANLLKMGEGMTRNAAIAIAASAHDLPLLLDNYKPNTGGGAKGLIQLIHNVVEGSEKARMNRAAQLQDQKELRAWPLVTGEDLPDTDAASLARMLSVAFTRDDLADTEALTAAQRNEDLPMIGRLWLDWIVTEEARATMEGLEDAFMDRRERWKGLLKRKKPDCVNILRVAQNLAACETVFHALCEGPFGDVLSPYEDEMEEGLRKIALDMGDYTKESLEAKRLLKGLKSLRASGRVILPHRQDYEGLTGGPGTELVGWHDTEGYYLLMDVALEAVADLYQREGGLNNVSKKALYSQLDSMDLIAKTGSSRTTRSVRIGDKIRRVLHLESESLDEEEDEDQAPF